MKTRNEVKITLDEFKLIKSFYPDFTRSGGIFSNDFIIGWSELMPVVAKFRDLVYEGTKQNKHRVLMNQIWGKLYWTNIEDVCKITVEGIKWQNAHKS